jgi:1,4-dihydroxy-2-naphthoate octaprenyltransferase
MLMTFLLNEYYDYETDLKNKEFHKLSGGSRVLPMGLLSRRQAFVAAHIFLLLAGILGLLLFFYLKTGPLTIPLGLVAIFIGYSYTASPIQLSYRGLGEIAIWFSCGWLATITGYYLQTGHFDTVATLVSLPGATSVFLVILINEIPDINSDRLANKKNLAVRLGRERAAILYSVLLILCYLNIVAIIFWGVPPISAILSIILIPLIIWILMTLTRKGLADRDVQEGLSLRTMLLDHLITIIYAITFIVAGLSLATIRLDYLIMLAIAFVVVFGLEGLGIACSRIVLQEAVAE